MNYRYQDGTRPNNDLETKFGTLHLKQQVSRKASFYFQGSWVSLEAGDVAPRYDERIVLRGLRYKENQEPIAILGYHHEWSPGSHTLAMVGRLDDTVQFFTPLGAVPVTFTNPVPTGQNFTSLMGLSRDHRVENTTYISEVQHIIQSEDQGLIIGGRYHTGTIDLENNQVLDFPQFVLDDFFTNIVQSFDTDLERYSGYAYYHRQIGRITPLGSRSELRLSELSGQRSFRAIGKGTKQQ